VWNRTSPLAGAPRGGVSLQPSSNQATEPRSGPHLIVALFYEERSLIGGSNLVFFEEGVLDHPKLRIVYMGSGATCYDTLRICSRESSNDLTPA
jgi:hypothetical protein